MRVLVLLSMVGIAMVSGEAPYAPSGWKPPGPAFNLPSRQKFQPQLQPQYSTPLNERRLPLPSPPANRDNNYPFRQIQPNYGLPTQPNGFNTETEFQPRPNYNLNENRNYPDFSGRSSQNVPLNVEGRNFRNFNRGFGTQTEDFNGSADVPSPEYGIGYSTTEQTVNIPRKRPERTTQRPITTSTTEFIDDEVEEQPNIAVSNSVANGQYFILQPDGQLQRVIYMTSEDVNNPEGEGFITNLKYENVQPLKGPVFSYNDSPVVQVN